jgi:hypothetical protein
LSELGFLKELGGWGIFLFILIAVSLRIFWGVNKDESRGRWVARLRHDGFARRYKALLAAALDWLDRRLSPDFPVDAELPKIEPARAWSWRLLDLTLLFAVAYPVLGVVVDWAFTGDAARLGGVEAIAAESVWSGDMPHENWGKDGAHHQVENYAGLHC